MAMTIDHRPPTRIHGNYLHVHENKSMKNQQSKYEQSTFIGNNTIIDGLSQENEPSLTNANVNS